MQFPQKIGFSEKIRNISTTNIDALAQFQVNKNRQYTQLQSGVLCSNYNEVNLGSVQVFRESLTAGARIEAAPASTFLPFAVILPGSGNARFCGRERPESAIIQATGGEWDICFEHRLDYVCAAFDREALNCSIEHLTGHAIPASWLTSKACSTSSVPLQRYAQGISTILKTVNAHPNLLSTPNAERMLNSEVLMLAIKVLTSTSVDNHIVKPQPKRIRGVQRVIDYLNVHARQLPTIADLCKIAGLSERSLEYGFQEYMGVTPVRYLRIVRLNGVKRDLISSHSGNVKIVDIALKWGFVELGRFAGEYRQLFGELPSDTRRSLL